MTFLFKKNVKRILAAARSYTGSPPSKYGARILMYHSVGGDPRDHPLGIRVGVDNFEEQARELAGEGYKSLTVSELVENLPAVDSGRYVVITFDDGYKDNIVFAAGIIKRFKLKTTFFISAACIEREVKKMWADGSSREYMDWADIIELDRMGFEIGSHMVHHVDLSLLNDDDLRNEFVDSREIISGKIGKPVRVFSYPYGKVNDRIVEIAGTSGYIGGCSSLSGVNHAYVNRHILRRTEIDGYDTIKDFRRKMSGYYDQRR